MARLRPGFLVGPPRVLGGAHRLGLGLSGRRRLAPGEHHDADDRKHGGDRIQAKRHHARGAHHEPGDGGARRDGEADKRGGRRRRLHLCGRLALRVELGLSLIGLAAKLVDPGGLLLALGPGGRQGLCRLVDRLGRSLDGLDLGGIDLAHVRERLELLALVGKLRLERVPTRLELHDLVRDRAKLARVLPELLGSLAGIRGHGGHPLRRLVSDLDQAPASLAPLSTGGPQLVASGLARSRCIVGLGKSANDLLDASPQARVALHGDPQAFEALVDLGPRCRGGRLQGRKPRHLLAHVLNLLPGGQAVRVLGSHGHPCVSSRLGRSVCRHGLLFDAPEVGNALPGVVEGLLGGRPPVERREGLLVGSLGVLLPLAQLSANLEQRLFLLHGRLVLLDERLRLGDVTVKLRDRGIKDLHLGGHAAQLRYARLCLRVRVDELRDVLRYVGDSTPVARLLVELAAILEPVLSLVKAGDVIGLVDKRVQAVAQAGRRAVEAKPVLDHEHALLERVGIEPEEPLAHVFANLRQGGLPRLDVYDLESVLGGSRPKGADHAILLAACLEVEGTSVRAALPGLVAKALVLRQVADALALEPVEHRLNECGKRRLAPAVGLHDHVKAVVEGQVVVAEGAKVVNVASKEFHSVGSFPFSTFQPQRKTRVFSVSLNESSPTTCRTNSASSDTSVSRSATSMSSSHPSATST